MIFFKVNGIVYRAEDKYIILRVDTEDADKLNYLMETTKKLYMFKINTVNAKIKDISMLECMTNWKEIEGKNICCSGIVKNYSFVNKENQIVEGKSLLAKKIIKANTY